MASTSGCADQLKDLRLADTSCMMGDSSKKLDFATATLASEVDYTTSSTSYSSAVEEQIERSKAHWSTLVDHSSDTDDEEVDWAVSNKQEFEALQRHPTWGGFFGNFTGDGISTGFSKVHGELVMGNKFVEGGQAELYEAQVKWNNPETTEYDQRTGYKYVLKVFKEGTFLKDLKSQMPQGVLQFYVEHNEYQRSRAPKSMSAAMYYTLDIYCGILLEGGRFAFLMNKEHCDLCTLIESNMKLRTGEKSGPFTKEQAQVLMYSVAMGVDWLHNYDIVHRDLKASNVLVWDFGSDYAASRWDCYVADYECSIGVVGTNFFRAPEILQVCKERKVKERSDVFSRAADVYSYGMICYEILTGKLPFEDHALKYNYSSLFDLVVNQHLRLEIPTYVEDWIHELLGGCWQFDPTKRPTIGKILEVLSTNSTEVRRYKVEKEENYDSINWEGFHDS